MAESTLSITYTDLQAEVGAFLHYGQDPDNWSADETKRVDRFIQAGLRQFYYPPQMEGVELGYTWSFMYPTTTLTTADGTRAYDLPDLFQQIDGEFHYEEDVFWQSISHVSEARMLELIEYSDDEDKPRYFTTRAKDSTGATGQRFEVLFWPKPDAAYTLTYRYKAYAGKLDAVTYKYPLGGMQYGECIIESCLAIAESRGNDEAGFHQTQFARLLAAAVAQDRRQSARRYGDMGGHEDGSQDIGGHHNHQTFYRMTYKGSSW